MASSDGRLVIVFNGEIYNFAELRADLEGAGRRFRTTSDTEVLLHLYAACGPAMVRRLRGMYAFAIWDEARRGLLLARDPFGIKPLYTANDGWTFRFASQVKALLAGGGVSRDPEPAGLVGFHLFGSVPEPFTLYRDIRALPAGHVQWVDSFGPHPPKPFFSIPGVLAEGARAPARAGEIDERVRSAVLDSVRAHLVSDVEVGVFLSAGVDSGAMLGLMRDAGKDRIRALTLTYSEFEGTSEDEGLLAARVAREYGAEHIVRRVSEREFRADLPAILDAMDQPSIDGVNTWFVSKAAREAGLKVALSGLGGDELLAGYPSFRDVPRWAGWLGPISMLHLGGTCRRVLDALAPPLRERAPKALGLIEFGGNYAGAYLVRRSLFLPFELSRYLEPDLVREGLRRLQPLKRLAASLLPDPGSALGRVAALEAANYMRNQLLRDADWAGMAHSLEIRTPLVDVESLRAVASLLPKLAPHRGKRALAHAPSRALPAAVLERSKTGFGVPGWGYGGDDPVGLPGRKGAASRARALAILVGIAPRMELARTV
jgi:asparagine synthase (glutamine-hydrolysing)